MWSACPCVKRMPTTRRMPCRSACARRSGPASTRSCPPSPVATSTEVRIRRSRGSADLQTVQSQPIIGTPCDVPVPRKVIFTADAAPPGRRLREDDALLAFLGLDEAHAELVEQIVDELGLGRQQVALRLRLQHGEDLDHLPGGGKVRLGALSGVRVGNVAKLDRGGR